MIEREFDYQSQKNNASGILMLRIYMPKPTNDNDWECKYVLEFPKNSIEGKLIGVDSFQALLLAIKTAKIRMVQYATSNQITITWLGMDNIGLEL